MPMTEYQRLQQVIRKNEEAIADAKAKGKLIEQGRKNYYRPEPKLQAEQVRNQLTDRYRKIGAGAPGTDELQRPDSRGRIKQTRDVVASGSAPGLRVAILKQIDTKNRVYPDSASKVKNRQEYSQNVRNQSAANNVIGGTPRTATNATTLFQEGLRAHLQGLASRVAALKRKG